MDESLRNYYNRIISGGSRFDRWTWKSVDNSVHDMVLRMFDRTRRMFKWNNLPESIPERDLELLLQTSGFAGITEANGELYAFWGGLGGKPNPYYMPTMLTVANPGLDFNKVLTIDKDCIIIPNDTLYRGLSDLHRKYATMIAETELSAWMMLINSRIPVLVSGADDRTRKSVERMFERIEKGELSVVSETALIDALKTTPYSGTTSAVRLTDYIEMIQYWRASWWNELGLNANYNMKRESLNSAESQLNDDALLPLVDDMLKCRQDAVEKVNAMFGTSISVSLASAWEDNQIEVDEEQNAISEHSENAETEAGETDVAP